MAIITFSPADISFTAACCILHMEKKTLTCDCSPGHAQLRMHSYITQPTAANYIENTGP